MFANEKKAYQFGSNIFHQSICINSLEIIEALNNKIFMRDFLYGVVNTPPSISLPFGKSENFSFIKKVFDNRYSEFVVQTTESNGGSGTFLLNYRNCPSFESNIQVLITPYFENSIPINVHIAIERDTYRIFPPSVQVILNRFNYSGSDFIRYQMLESSLRNKVIECCQNIAMKLMTLECTGVFGVDLLLIEQEVFFLECNFRYQGSSFILNKALIEKNFPSIFQINYDCFYNSLANIPKDIYTMPIYYSCLRRTINNLNIRLPNPILTIKDSDFSKDFSNDGYIYHELFDISITNFIEKQ
ncbi:MAG: ATP-grasp domain-containing protein [Candidatus Gracilibacteria bacterium]|nr:ATP-grasp domain-containing protein [Candidatus Gracilibacteria bacterium]